MTFDQIAALAEITPLYLTMRRQHPEKPASQIHDFLRSDSGESFEEFCCRGHEWEYTGSAYGGDDDRYFGEGRCYCIHCGADGDA